MSAARAAVLATCVLTAGCTVFEQHDLQIEPHGPITQVADSPLALPNAPVFRVGIHTTPDLVSYADRTGFKISAAMSLCTNGQFDPARPLQSDPNVHDTRGTGVHADAPAAPWADYFLYARVRAVPLTGQNIQWYDLAQMPQDVCVVLQGGEMLTGSFRSNTLVIPTGVIAGALRVTP